MVTPRLLHRLVDGKAAKRRGSGGRCRRELSDNEPAQGVDRLEIFRRDFRLRNSEIELGLDGEHQIDHVHRRQSDIDQQRLRIEIGYDCVLVKDGADQSE